MTFDDLNFFADEHPTFVSPAREPLAALVPLGLLKFIAIGDVRSDIRLQSLNDLRMLGLPTEFLQV